MDLVYSTIIPAASALYVRILIRYGAQSFPLQEKSIDKIFAQLLATLDALIFIHKDILISKEKPSLRGNQAKQLLKLSDSFRDPVLFEGQFNLDCNSDDAGPRALINSPQSIPTRMHKLSVDLFFPITPDILEGDLFTKLQDAVCNYLADYQRSLKAIFKEKHSIPRSLTAYYFRHEDRLIRVFYPPYTDDEPNLRKQIHKCLGLPEYPIVRRGLALFPTASFKRLLGPNKENLVCPHLLLPHIQSNGDVTVEIVRGRYTYKHYLQDNIDDKNWGCAYRSLQTLVSWLLWQGIVVPLQALPSHRSIQEALVKVGDKQPKFIGSRQWIGSLEVSFCISELYDVQCRLLPVARGRDFTATAAAVLVEHFSAGGGPVMVGGGELAHTIIGVSIADSGKARYLILDPHYTGTPCDTATILSKGWVGWKEEGFWKPDVPYNLCMLPPPDDSCKV